MATEIPLWRLAAAEPSTPRPIARIRISPETSLPDRCVLQLCPEFSLVTITTASNWISICRQLELSTTDAALDFNTGMVVGIIARVGESFEGRWPISLRRIRCYRNAGALEVGFTAGLYYPIQGPPYLELAYAPKCHHIYMVQVNDRQFTIDRGPHADVHHRSVAKSSMLPDFH